MIPARTIELARKYAEPAALLAVLLGLSLAGLFNFLLFFSLIEALIILLAFSIFVFAWNTRKLHDDLFLLVIGYGSLSFAVLSLLYALTDRVSIFPHLGINLSPRLLFGSMIIKSISLLAATFVLGRKGSPAKAGAVFAAVTVVLLGAAFLALLPPSYTDDGTPTVFKRVGSLSIALLYLLAIINLLRKDRSFNIRIYHFLIAALLSSAIAAILFAYNTIGISSAEFFRHTVRLLSWYLLYRAIALIGFDEPMARQNRTLRQKEEELRDSEKRFRAIYERSPTGIALIDFLSGRFLQVNPKFCEITGYDQQELVLLDFRQITLVEDLQPNVDSMDLLLEGKSRYFSMEKRYVRKDGSVVWVHMTVVPMWDEHWVEGSGPRQNLAMFEDITARKRAEHALKLSEKKYRDLFEHANDAIFIIDAEYRYSDVNHKAVELLGYSREELLAMRIFDLIPSDQAPRSREMLRKLGVERSDEKFIGRMKARDGRLLDVEVSSSAIEADGVVIGARDIVRDITERTRREEERRVDDLRLHILLTITQHETSSLQELLGLALEGVVALSGSELGYIFAYSEKKEEFTLHAWSKNVMDSCFIADRSTAYKMTKTCIWGEVVRLRGPVVINDFKAPHSLKQGYPGGHAPLERFMALPVMQQQRIVAVVAVANKKDLYTDLDVRHLRLLMDAIWTIAERKLVEQALKESQAMFRRLVDSNIIGIITMNDEKVLVANDIFLTMTGYDRTDLEQGKLLWRDMTPRESVDRDLQKVQDLLTVGFCTPYEKEYLRRDGSRVPVLIGSALIRNNPLLLISFVLDLSERKQAELERETMLNTVDRMRMVAEQRADELSAIFSTLMEPVIIYGSDGDVLRANPAAFELHGFDPRLFIGPGERTITNLLNPEGSRVSAERLPAMRALNGETVVNEPFSVIDKNGKAVIGHISAAPFYSKNGMRGAVVAWHDITELERTKAALQQAYDVLEERVRERTSQLAKANLMLQSEIEERTVAEEELLRSRQQLRDLSVHLQSVLEREREGIAREIHDELGQSLTAIKLDLSWLHDRYADHHLLLKKIDSMVNLIDMSITSVKRIASELRPAILDHLGLAAAVEWQTKEFGTRTGIDCRLVITPDDLVADRDRSTALFRILQEALTNVIRHAEASEVLISLRKSDGKITLQIKDNGKGITLEQSADHRAFGLMGIRERVLFFNGDVDISSGGPMQGTSVTIRIPLDEAATAL